MNPGSHLSVSDTGLRLDLVTGPAMTPQGLVDDARFFSGFVARSDLAAAGLLAVADVAGTRYADFGQAQRLASLDPVVTASGDRLRFESFSVCTGVYARFDLLREGLGSSDVGFGTTNVDVNQPLRSALSRVGRSEPLHLAVGVDDLTVSSFEETVTEPKVPLPDRWVRAMAETSRIVADMEPVASMSGVAARRFLGALPRIAPPGPELHVVPMSGGWRTVSRPVGGSVPLPGASRLRGSDRLLRHVHRVSLYAHELGSTAWVFEVDGARLTIALSPGPFRAFTGEGSLLGLLAHPEAEADGRRLLDHLGWTSVVDPAALAARTGLPDDRVRVGLGWVAASGRLGYDLDDRAWFHRELPVDSEAVVRRNPRLRGAQRLVDTGGVRPDVEAGTWLVRGSDGEDHTVAPSLTCTCLWEAQHHGSRGPCKHVLAVLLTRGS